MDKETNCITAGQTHLAYAELVAGKLCRDGRPCMRDECEHCGPLNALIDHMGEQCELRGCTLARCIYD